MHTRLMSANWFLALRTALVVFRMNLYLNLINFCVLKKAKSPYISDLFIFVCKAHRDFQLPSQCSPTSCWEVLLPKPVERKCQFKRNRCRRNKRSEILWFYSNHGFPNVSTVWVPLKNPHGGHPFLGSMCLICIFKYN